MSIKAMTWLREITTGKASYKHVLTALSDIHHEVNDTCFASMGDLRSHTELNEKTIKSALEWLQKAGFITRDNSQGVAPNYTLHFDVTSSKIGEGKRAGNTDNFKQTPSKIGEGTPSKIGAGQEETTPTKIGDNPLQIFPTPPPKLEDKQAKQDKQDKNPTSQHPVATEEKTEEEIRQERYLNAAAAMWEKIQPVKKREVPPNLTTWAKHIRLLVELDNVDLETVWRVFVWANKDHFWRANIMSPAKLREQFDTIYARMENGNAANRPGRNSSPNEPKLTPAQRTAAKREQLRRSQSSDMGTMAAHGGDIRPSVGLATGGRTE